MSKRQPVLTIHRAFRSRGIEAIALAHVFADRTAACTWRIGTEEVPDADRHRLASSCERYAMAALPGQMVRRGRQGRIEFTHAWVQAGAGHDNDDDGSAIAHHHTATEEVQA